MPDITLAKLKTHIRDARNFIIYVTARPEVPESQYTDTINKLSKFTCASEIPSLSILAEYYILALDIVKEITLEYKLPLESPLSNMFMRGTKVRLIANANICRVSSSTIDCVRIFGIGKEYTVRNMNLGECINTIIGFNFSLGTIRKSDTLKDIVILR